MAPEVGNPNEFDDAFKFDVYSLARVTLQMRFCHLLDSEWPKKQIPEHHVNHAVIKATQKAAERGNITDFISSMLAYFKELQFGKEVHAIVARNATEFTVVDSINLIKKLQHARHSTQLHWYTQHSNVSISLVCASLRAHRSLQLLDLTNYGVDTNKYVVLSCLKEFPHLKVLNLNNNTIGNVGAQILSAHLPPSLVELDLTNCKIGKEGFTVLRAGFSNCKLLQSLKLSHNAIECASAAYILEHNQCLETLVLQGAIQDNNVQILGAAIKKALMHLKVLDLRNNELDWTTLQPCCHPKNKQTELVVYYKDVVMDCKLWND